MVTTSITVGELYCGRYRRNWHQKRVSILETFLSTLNILSFSRTHVREYGQIRASLLDMGLDIGFVDIAIAAITRVEDLPLFTVNLEHFNHVQGISITEYIKK